MVLEELDISGEDRKINRLPVNNGNALYLKDNISLKTKKDTENRRQYNLNEAEFARSSGIAIKIIDKKSSPKRTLNNKKEKDLESKLQGPKNREGIGPVEITRELLEQFGVEFNQDAQSLLDQTLGFDEQKWLLEELRKQDDEDIGVLGNSIKDAFISSNGKELAKLRETNAGNYFRYKFEEQKFFQDWKNGALESIQDLDNREIIIFNAISEFLSESKGDLTEEYISREVNVVLGAGYTKQDIDAVLKKYSVLNRKDLIGKGYIGNLGSLLENFGKVSEEGSATIMEKARSFLDIDAKEKEQVQRITLIALPQCSDEQIKTGLNAICSKPAEQITAEEFNELLMFNKLYVEHLSTKEGFNPDDLSLGRDYLELYKIEISEEYSRITFITTDEYNENLYNFWEVQRTYWESVLIESREVSNSEESIPEAKALSKGENAFIQNQNTSSLDEQFSQLYGISRDQTSENNERMQRILSLLPQEQYENIFEKLEHNQVLLQGFEESTGIQKAQIPLLLKDVLDGNYPEDQLKNGREWLRVALRKAYGGEIQGIVDNIQGTLKQQAGECALNLKTNYLEESLGFSIFQTQEDLDKEKPEEGTFYFRDKNHPDTQYCYNALTGAITAEESYVQDNGIIRFGGGKPILIKQLLGYNDLIGKLDITSIFLENGRTSNMEELTSIMRNNIIPQLHFSDGTEEIARIKEKNENARVKNEIIANIGKIFGLEPVINSKEDITESSYGPYYLVLNAALNTLNNPNENLEEFNRFVSNLLKIKEAIVNKRTVGGDILKSPLARFIEGKVKYDNELQYQQEDGSSNWGKWKAKDITMASILTNLIKVKENAFDSELMMNLNNSGENDRIMVDFMKNVSLKYDEYSSEIKKAWERELEKTIDAMYRGYE